MRDDVFILPSKITHVFKLISDNTIKETVNDDVVCIRFFLFFLNTTIFIITADKKCFQKNDPV